MAHNYAVPHMPMGLQFIFHVNLLMLTLLFAKIMFLTYFEFNFTDILAVRKAGHLHIKTTLRPRSDWLKKT